MSTHDWLQHWLLALWSAAMHGRSVRGLGAEDVREAAEELDSLRNEAVRGRR